VDGRGSAYQGGASSMEQLGEGSVVLQADGAELIADGQRGQEVHGG